MIKVIKKDGTICDFNKSKIINAVNKSATRCLVKLTEDETNKVCNNVEDYLKNNIIREIHVSDLHCIVENALEDINKDVAKSYREYRNYKVDFCEMLDYLSSPEICKEIGLLDMALNVKKMLSDAISCFMSKDTEKAKNVETYDDFIDACFSEARKKLYIVIRSGKEGYEEAADVVIGAKYLERMGDHAASIAHSVIEECGTVEESKSEG